MAEVPTAGPPGGAHAALDDIVRGLEEAWVRDGAADLGRHLPAEDHPFYREVLGELVCVDLELGWRHGRPRPLGEYVRLYPALAADPERLRRAAYEEYRQRRQAGEDANPAEYRDRFGVPTAGWYDPTPADFVVPGDTEHDRPDVVIPGGTTLRRPVTLVPAAAPGSEVAALLRRRLRLAAVGAVGTLGYFAALVLLAPGQKVGLFLERGPLVALNWTALGGCAALAALLWTRRPLSVKLLRRFEAALLGLVVAELAAGMASDLFLDDELRQPLAEGDHALFHYASSWSLPFFAVAVGYGALVPSTGRRCAAVVAAVAAVPLAISGAAAADQGLWTREFLVSYLLQMALWMAAAGVNAASGAHRLEALRREASEARRLGQYRLVRRIGAGGMGEVYLAEHVLLRRPCAVKVIHPNLAGDPDVLRRFEHEARAVAGLTHPNTCTVFDYGAAEDGTFYIAMEYLPGPNLDRLVGRGGPLPPDRAVRLLRQVCGALAEAHAAGLVHRDLKPSNVIVCDRGGVPDVAKLLDFGLVQGAGPDRPGREAAFAGTPAYASPEQAAGDRTDARSDVYSLGAVAYFLLAGRPPFARPTPLETLLAHAHDPVPPPAGVPPGLAAVVLRCLEKDPDRRYPDAAAIDRALADTVL